MSESAAMYPGTFDCPTFGHINLIERCADVFERLLVAVAANTDKEPLFTAEERVRMLRESIPTLPNVEVLAYNGLTVHFAREHGIPLIIRGLRAVSDFESELQLALMNKRIAPEIETIFLPPGAGFEFVSSTLTKEIIRHDGDISSLVPPHVETALRTKFNLAPKPQP